jgi:hypothetical protein
MTDPDDEDASKPFSPGGGGDPDDEDKDKSADNG